MNSYIFSDADRVVKTRLRRLVVKSKADFFLFYTILDVKSNIDLAYKVSLYSLNCSRNRQIKSYL